MRTGAKLAGFALALAALFGGAYGVGHVVGPLRGEPAVERPVPQHDGDMPGMGER
ncbi:hypothetical protein [Actinocatenispora rupis]|uniref:Uncharacterized protein n=1 Tax=Actinocatenispora rupis TaxID=519421 RepID=A0A8J3NAU3_9ACTN|nr:hypothetical protein [Actinocatenispora rupis]GID12456.1 hypothetical protein Aru02nite_33450 [Actinocatenispora rupis]